MTNSITGSKPSHHYTKFNKNLFFFVLISSFLFRIERYIVKIDNAMEKLCKGVKGGLTNNS
jgi:hypothetical protein